MTTQPLVYNPFNAKNRLFTKQDIQAILEKHNCVTNVKNVSLYQEAMVHSSYVERTEYVSPTGDKAQLADKPTECIGLFKKSYERLEHLGDSVLGSCVSTYLMERYNEDEGFMTDLKKSIVCNEMLGTLSQKIGLDKFYIISRHNEDVCSGRTNSKKLGDILEAFIGALWTDSKYNFQVVYSFVVCLIETYIDIPKILMNNTNYKEQLQKLYQARFHQTPKYEVVSAATNMYTMAAVDEKGIHLGIGTAPTKKQAEQLAAAEAIKNLQPK